MGGVESDSEEDDLTEDEGSTAGSDSTHVSLNDDESVDVRAYPDLGLRDAGFQCHL